jgi:hypothetical protein
MATTAIKTLVVKVQLLRLTKWSLHNILVMDWILTQNWWSKSFLQIQKSRYYCDDSDAPSGCHCHWLYGIFFPKQLYRKIAFGIQGRNSMGTNKYIGPCPQAGYINIILKSMLWTLNWIHCPQVPTKIDGSNGPHIISGELLGLYEK